MCSSFPWDLNFSCVGENGIRASGICMQHAKDLHRFLPHMSSPFVGKWSRNSRSHFQAADLSNLSNYNGRKIPKRLMKVGMEALRALIQLLQCLQVGKGESEKSTANLPLFMLYFDDSESFVLRRPWNMNGGSRLDAITSAMSFFVGQAAFFVFLTTNQYAALLAPPRHKLQSEYAKEHFGAMVHPFFGCRIDYIPQEVNWSSTSWETLSTVGFLSMFGRGLYVALNLHATEITLTHAYRWRTLYLDSHDETVLQVAESEILSTGSPEFVEHGRLGRDELLDKRNRAW